ncbi:MAG: [protein-PII] uridylyltransferase [Alphaproteobacteria bacterium]
MKHIDNTALVDIEQLKADIETIIDQKNKEEYCRDELLSLLKDNRKQALDEVKLRLKKTPYFTGDVFAQLMADYTDVIVKHIYYIALAHFDYHIDKIDLSLIAVGGYGRREMAPYSDIDLLFLIPKGEKKYHQEIIGYILHFLWDLNLKVGQSVRNINEAITLSLEDNTICTTLLDARLVTGSQDIFQKFTTEYQSKVVAKKKREFIAEKLLERDKRHTRTGGSRFLLEPNIKEGKGGLRDMQALVWLNKFAYGYQNIEEMQQADILSAKDKRRYQRAYRFIWTIRFWMHLLSKRANEQLTFDLQKQIATEMGYWDTPRLLGVERLMRHLFLRFSEVGWLTAITCSQLEEANQKRPTEEGGHLLSKEQQAEGFILKNGRLSHQDAGSWIIEKPINIMRIFKESQISNRFIHPELLYAVRQNSSKMTQLQNEPEAIKIFWEILTAPNGASTLRNMGLLGVLSRFIPAWGPIKCQMQYNMYHHYTTDEHTIVALDEYHKIQKGDYKDKMPWVSELTQQIPLTSKIMPITILLHDIAKGREEDHSILGAEMALDICPRLGLNEGQTELVSWLVRYHLYMSDVSSRRDLDDEKTIDSFIQNVSTPEQLRYLTLLTICDIRAVSPNTWTEWKGNLLRKLFVRAAARISGQSHRSLQREEIATAQYQLHNRLINDAWNEEEIQKLAEIATPSWWLGFSEEAQYFHANLLKGHNGKDIKIHMGDGLSSVVNEMTVIAPDQRGLFAKIAGALAISNTNIVDARAVTLKNGLILDSFRFTDVLGNFITSEAKLQRIKDNVHKALLNQMDWQKESQKFAATLPTQEGKKYTHFSDYARVNIPKNASSSATVVEVTGRDRPGFLFDITKVLMQFNLQIITARIATYGEKVVDVFYIKDRAGLTIDSQSQLQTLKEALLKASKEQNAFDML